MRQLVGLKCTRCEKSISSVVEGLFCPRCECPVHNWCARLDPGSQNSCTQCGSCAEVVAVQQEQEAKQAAATERDVRTYHGFRDVGMGMAWIVGGILASVFCFGVSVAAGGSWYIAAGPIAIGFAQIIYGIVVMSRKTPQS
jgi:hypothetical protein